MVSKKLIALSTATILAVGAYWAAAPYLTLYHIKTSVKALDADAFNSHVDYPKLRESMKEQLATKIMENVAKESGSSEQSALGAKLVLGLSNKLIDNMVSPDMVKRAMSSGMLGPGATAEADTPEPSESEDAAAPEIEWSTERDGASRFLVHVNIKHKTLPKQASLVLGREGFASWKVVSIVLPKLPDTM